ncbi:choice-of-anchor M domain-containing protein [Actinocorallia sp. API 0066]|uniref:choice-of-anchor M domain-containing protein n=1 Tax=Actinocorallia sp. API 0066 TaxID=2896846 RepID=UPI001E521C10|nr:choice-of-anchor M domain-containing protein [Actinocorallia sp. API 0066]MCD0452462.1 choice-of-anchor M domain-containing protein [Actinocorallia sp. API 0066]
MRRPWGWTVRRGLGVLGGVALVVAVGLPGGGVGAAPPQAPVAVELVGAGHVDVLVPKVVGDVLEVASVPAGGAVFAPGARDFHVGGVAVKIVDQVDGELLKVGDWYVAASGATAGTPVLGFSVAEVGAVQGAVAIELTDVDLPQGGGVEVFKGAATTTPEAEAAKATDRVLSSDPAPAGRKYEMQAGVAGHEDFNWAFSAPGRYRLTFTVSGTTADGKAVKSAPVTHTFHVGSTAPAGTATTTTTTLAAAAGATAGQTALTATVTAVGSPRGWVEFLDGTTSLASVEVVGGQAKGEYVLAEGQHTLNAVFHPKFTNDYATSQATALSYTVPVGSGGGVTPTPTPTPTTSVTPTPTPTPTDDDTDGETECRILTEGDLDYAVRLKDGKAESALKEGATWHDLGTVVVKVPAAAKLALPAGQAFLGEAGTPVWELPQAAQAGIPSVGWLAEGTAGTWKLDKVDGPGKAALFEISADGTPRVLLDGAGDSKALSSGEHGHATWAFTKEGVYRLTFTHETTSNGKDTGVLTFAVGAYDSVDLPKCEAKGGGSLADTGAPVLLYASVGVMLVTSGAVLLVGANRRFGLF